MFKALILQVPAVTIAMFTGQVVADTYYVPGDYATIQAAWDAVPGSGGPGWFILVEPGIYNENLDLSDKTCWVIGLGDTGDVVIDGNSNGAVIEITNSPFDGGAFLENLELRNGTGTASSFFTYGGAINLWNGGDASLYECNLIENLAIYGGAVHVGTNSSLFAYECIFAGNIAYFGGAVLSQSWTTIDDSSLSANTAYYGGHVCAIADTESVVISDSSLISGSSVIATEDNTSGGGAIAVLNSGEVTVRNCNLLDNSAEERGGAIYVKDAAGLGGTRTVTIIDSLIRLNDADISGGGIYFDDSGSLKVENTEFQFNESSYGGSGCWLELGEFTFDQCNFSDQTMVDVGTGFRNGGGIFALDCDSLIVNNSSFNRNDSIYYGGALYLNSSPTVLTNCVFDANDAGSWADAIEAVRYIGAPNPNTLTMTGCQIINHPDSTAVRSSSGVITATNCTFSNNNQGFLSGGAVWIYNDYSDDPCAFTNCTFSGNSTGDRGAALHLEDCTVEIDGCDFMSNTVDGPNDFRGGAIFAEDESYVTIEDSLFDGNHCDGDGGAIGMSDSAITTITECTFSDNTATEDGGAVHISSSASSTSLNGSTFERNEANLNGGAVFNQKSGSSINGCDIRENIAGALGGGIRGQSYTTLANTVVCGNTPSQTSGNIGDLGGNTIGATCTSCPGDFDGSGVVDGSDLAMVLGAWGPCAGCPEDLTGDGVVNGADLAIVLGAWGACP